MQEDEPMIIPSDLFSLQEFLETLYEEIMNNKSKEKISLYNEAAKLYNDKTKFAAYTILNKQNMATKKKPATKTIVVSKKKTVKKQTKAIIKDSIETFEKIGTKKLSQKEQIVPLASQGKSILEINKITGIRLENIRWYFSKLKLGK